jgi:hypothetical protein
MDNQLVKNIQIINKTKTMKKYFTAAAVVFIYDLQHQRISNLKIITKQ